MKIALLTEKYTPDIGGLAISAGRLGHLLTSASHDVFVYAPSYNLQASETRTLIQAGISVTRFGARKRIEDTLVDWFDLVVQEHSREPFNILHAYFLSQAGFVAAYAGNYLGVPSVASARGNDLDRAVFDPGRAAHVLYALENASAITMNACDLMQKAKALAPGREVLLIPNGVDADHFKVVSKNPVLASQLGILDSPVIGFVGELREKKGLRSLLAAYTQVLRSRPVVLLIVGGLRPGDDSSFFDEFRRSNPDSQIIVTGFIPPADLPSYYALMDVFVQPSLRDGLPNAVLEAMACEKAVITTRVGGLPDVIQDGVNGRMVPVGDVPALAQVLLDLLADSTTLRDLGQAARATVVAKFTLQSELQANLQLYKRLV